jgi:pimeloyl-[acyl-carrier protein] methyl ester esterase
MHLHVDISGAGEPLVMLHGWGMHGGIWQEAAAALAQDFEVHNVDLPGHGLSAIQGTSGSDSPPFTLDGVVDALRSRFDRPVSVMGWSLGGLIAQHWARREPAQVGRLLLLASTPCFARRNEWTSGMSPELLEQFGADLERHFAETLRRFLGLQLRGSEGEREMLAVLRERLFSRGEPEMAALRGGLAILRDADLRSALCEVMQPVLVIAGERDRLTPVQASRYMAQTMPNARLVEIAGAAHAPFLSHRDEVVAVIREFMKA